MQWTLAYLEILTSRFRTVGAACKNHLQDSGGHLQVPSAKKNKIPQYSLTTEVATVAAWGCDDVVVLQCLSETWQSLDQCSTPGQVTAAVKLPPGCTSTPELYSRS